MSEKEGMLTLILHLCVETVLKELREQMHWCPYFFCVLPIYIQDGFRILGTPLNDNNLNIMNFI